MKSNIIAFIAFVAVFILPLVSAHWIVGYVQDALDGTSPNGRTIRLWNVSTGQEVYGTVGVPQDQNIFMIYCGESSTLDCEVGDVLNATVVDDGSGYAPTNNVTLTVSGNGFDSFSENLTVNSPPEFVNLTVDDVLSSPENEIDLTAASTTKVYCSGIITEYEGDSSMQSISSEFYSSSSFFGDTDDNNHHYSNNSCEVDETYGGSTQLKVNCSFDVEYYAEAGSWDCTLNATDNYSASTTYSDSTTINTLLALGVNDSLNFGIINSKEVTPELVAEVVNYGNVMINLSLSGYAGSPGDGDAMDCTGSNITINYVKYNLTSSNSGPINLGEFESKYTNLTSGQVSEKYNLNYRTNDIENDAKNKTYWRTYVPEGVAGPCTGNIIFGATQS